MKSYSIIQKEREMRKVYEDFLNAQNDFYLDIQSLNQKVAEYAKRKYEHKLDFYSRVLQYYIDYTYKYKMMEKRKGYSANLGEPFSLYKQSLKAVSFLNKILNELNLKKDSEIKEAIMTLYQFIRVYRASLKYVNIVENMLPLEVELKIYGKLGLNYLDLLLGKTFNPNIKQKVFEEDRKGVLGNEEENN